MTRFMSRCAWAVMLASVFAPLDACRADAKTIGAYLGYTLIGQPIKEGVLDPLFYSHAAEMLTKNETAIMAYASHGVPKAPRVAFVNIDDFPEVRDALGIEPDDEGPFAMLMEDYVFYDLDGFATTIPKGFIFDGASFPKDVLYKFIVNGTAGVQGSSYDPTVLAAGLIHDYMYRNPDNNPMYTQEYADMMIALNASFSGNKSAMEIWEGLWLAGSGAYRGHEERRGAGAYEMFTRDNYQGAYDRYLELREGWTSDQLWHRGGPTMREDTRQALLGDSTGDGGSTMVCYPDDELYAGYGTGGSIGSYLELPVAFVGFDLPYRRTMYLFSGDYPSGEDLLKTYDSVKQLFTGESPLRSDMLEYKKMWDTMKTEFERVKSL